MNSSTSYSKLPAPTKKALSLIRETVVGFDRITLWVNHPDPELPKFALERGDDKVSVQTRSVTFQSRWETKLEILQPSAEELNALTNALRGKCATKIPYAEIAIDWITDSGADAAQLQQYVLQHFRLRYSRYGVRLEKDTAYYGPRAEKPHGKRQRNVTVYADSPSKLAAGNNQPCCHLEYRLTSPELARIGLFTVGDCAGFDFTWFWSKHLDLVRISSKEDLGRILAPRKRTLSGSALRQRADLFLAEHAYQDGYVLQECLQQWPAIKKILEPVDNRHFLDKLAVH